MNGATGQLSGVGSRPSGAAAHARNMAHIADAREQFAAGADNVAGVRPEVLLSWYRCREQYQVDPQLEQAPTAPEDHPHPLGHNVVFAELGGHAASAADAIGKDGLVAVADPEGRILTSWGNRRVQNLAADSNLAPWAIWSESAAGTNGLGSALESHEPVLVRGPEHWCHGFQGWECAGIAVRDVVTDQPLAVVDISCWRSPLPANVLPWLRKIAAATEAKLHQRAHHHGTVLAGAFAETQAAAGTPLAAVDLAGKVVIANDAAAAYLGTPANASPAHAPTRRWTAQLPALPRLVGHATECAKSDPDWTGVTPIFIPFLDAEASVGIRPVFTDAQPIGMLLTIGSDHAQPGYTSTDTAGFPAELRAGAAAAPQAPSRVVACLDERSVLLDPREIRFARSDHNNVWLTTDHGQLLTAGRGLDHLEQQLAPKGFIRTHRSYLVNLGRVREIEPGIKGALTLITDARRRETVPVARRQATQIRQLLGL